MELNLKIKDFGAINNAEISINKINIVGGINSSGKSTASKVLYCFLKAMSANRNQYVLENILPDINRIIGRTANSNDEEASFNHVVNYDFATFLIDFYKAKQLLKSADFKKDGIAESIAETEKFLPMFLSRDDRSYSPVVRSLFMNESLVDFKGDATLYNDSFKSSVIYTPSDEGLSSSLLEKDNIQYDDYDKNHIYLTDGDFEYIPEVFYIDSVSIFDLDYYINTKHSIKRIFKYKEHLGYLLNQIRDDKDDVNLPDDVRDKINEVYDMTSEIIGGKLYYSPLFKISDIQQDGLYFKPVDGNDEVRVNISSGIQQIGVVQTLLHNYKLVPETFLIIDEPEVNLHPEWQIKFAQILMLLAKELDITLYLNSHSPMFIEALSLYSQYYGLINETEVYLTQKTENNQYDFVKVNPEDMGSIYENLTSPYDELDKLKAEILFKG